MAIVEIPINNPTREFSIITDLDSQTVDLSFKWNDTGQYWTFSISGQNLTDEVYNAAVVSGVNLLRPYAIRELGELYCIDTTDLGEDSDFDNFGSRWVLLYIEKGTIV